MNGAADVNVKTYNFSALLCHFARRSQSINHCVHVRVAGLPVLLVGCTLFVGFFGILARVVLILWATVFRWSGSSLNASVFVVVVVWSMCIDGHFSSMCSWVSLVFPHALHMLSVYMPLKLSLISVIRVLALKMVLQSFLVSFAMYVGLLFGRHVFIPCFRYSLLDLFSPSVSILFLGSLFIRVMFLFAFLFVPCMSIVVIL